MALFVTVRVSDPSSWTTGVLRCLAGRLGDDGYVSPDPGAARDPGFQRYEVYLGDPPPSDPAGTVRSLLDQCDSDWPGSIVVVPSG